MLCTEVQLVYLLCMITFSNRCLGSHVDEGVVVFFLFGFVFFCFELFLTLWSCVGFSVSFLFSAVNVIFFF